MEDSEDNYPQIEEFSFEEWAAKLKLSRQVTQTLRKEELTSRDTIKLLTERDLKEMSLPIGAIKLILVSISEWNSDGSIPAKEGSEKRDKNEKSDEVILDGAGKTLDDLLNLSDNPGPKTQPFAHSSPFMDPRTILTMRATNKKTVHITQFLTEETKRRRQNRRQKEFVLRSGRVDQETLVLKTDEEHPYLGIFMDEWGAANMRVLNHLLSTGQLKRDDIEFYLAYTTKIFEFAKSYEWNSILNFDFNYRELQAEHGFRWGTFSPHMEMQSLVPKRPKHPQQPQVQPQTYKEDCRIFKAKGSCPFGDKCRYKHSKPQPEQTPTKN